LQTARLVLQTALFVLQTAVLQTTVLQTARVDKKEVKFIEATVKDYAVAYQLALKVLWVSLDELSRWGRELIDHMKNQAQQISQDCKLETDQHKTSPRQEWTRRQLRETLRWPDKRLISCLEELVSLEYLQIISGGKGKTLIYALNPNFSHNPRALGLLTPDQLKAKLKGQK